jgi:hypothetical protein
MDATLICAEIRAAELLTALQDAVNGAAHWRSSASRLLRAIANHELPEPAHEALREADARKRAAELMDGLDVG